MRRSSSMETSHERNRREALQGIHRHEPASSWRGSKDRHLSHRQRGALGARIFLAVAWLSAFPGAAEAAYVLDRVFSSPFDLEDHVYGFGTRVVAFGDLVAVGSTKGVHLFDATSGQYFRTVDVRPPLCVGGDADGAPCDTCDLDGCPGGVCSASSASEYNPIAELGSRILIGTWNNAVDTARVNVVDSASGDVIRSFLSPPGVHGFGSWISADGDNIVIGSFDGAWIFDGETGDLVREFPPPADAQIFGANAVVIGEHLLVGGIETTPSGNTYQIWVLDKSTGEVLYELPGQPYVHLTAGRVFLGGISPLVDEVDPASGYQVVRTFAHPGYPECLPPGCGLLYGWAVAAASAVVAVADPLPSTGGVVYLFDGSSGEFLDKLQSPAPSDDVFGYSFTVLDDAFIIGTNGPESRDNCPCAANPDQADADGDRQGDACDPCPDDPSYGCLGTFTGFAHTASSTRREGLDLCDASAAAAPLSSFTTPSAAESCQQAALAALPASAASGADPSSARKVYRFSDSAPTPTPTSPPVAGCGPAPVDSCATAERGSLEIVGGSEPSGRRLTWKARRVPTAVASFGDPVTGATSYALCMYADGALVAPAIEIRPGEMCGASPCWQNLGTRGYRYSDRLGLRGPVNSLNLQEKGGRGSFTLKARGAALPVLLPLTPSIQATVQLVSDTASGAGCWETVLPSPARKSNLDRYKDSVSQ
jgi:hypothetical protein